MLKQSLNDSENPVTFLNLNLRLLTQLDNVLVQLVQELAHVLRLLRFWVHVVLRIKRGDFVLEHQNISVRRNEVLYFLRHRLEGAFLILSDELVLELYLGQRGESALVQKSSNCCGLLFTHVFEC